jgi:hypothetical protein
MNTKKKGNSMLDRNLKGAAGVHFVVARLSLNNFVALPTTRNLKAFDIVAFQHNNLSKAVYLQVKSTDKPKGGWPVHNIQSADNWRSNIRKSVSLGKNFYYVFVELPNGEKIEPSYYIVPSKDVANWIINHTYNWLKKHNKSAPGNYLLSWAYGGLTNEMKEKYINRWDLLSRKG